MVWDAISADHKSPLVVIQGNLNGQRYLQEIIQPQVMPLIQRMGGGGVQHAVFQDDNTRPHRAHIVMDHLQQQGVDHMDFPANSPDLTCIEQ